MTATFIIIAPAMVLAAFCFFRVSRIFIGDETIAMVFLAAARVLAPAYRPQHSKSISEQEGCYVFKVGFDRRPE